MSLTSNNLRNCLQLSYSASIWTFLLTFDFNYSIDFSSNSFPCLETYINYSLVKTNKQNKTKPFQLNLAPKDIPDNDTLTKGIL